MEISRSAIVGGPDRRRFRSGHVPARWTRQPHAAHRAGIGPGIPQTAPPPPPSSIITTITIIIIIIPPTVTPIGPIAAGAMVLALSPMAASAPVTVIISAASMAAIIITVIIHAVCAYPATAMSSGARLVTGLIMQGLTPSRERAAASTAATVPTIIAAETRRACFAFT